MFEGLLLDKKESFNENSQTLLFNTLKYFVMLMHKYMLAKNSTIRDYSFHSIPVIVINLYY